MNFVNLQICYRYSQDIQSDQFYNIFVWSINVFRGYISLDNIFEKYRLTQCELRARTFQKQKSFFYTN